MCLVLLLPFEAQLLVETDTFGSQVRIDQGAPKMPLRPYLHSSALLSLVLASFSDSPSMSTNSLTSQPHPFTPPPHTPYPSPQQLQAYLLPDWLPQQKDSLLPPGVPAEIQED